MIRKIPLRLRSIQVSTCIPIDPCGPDCLLTAEEDYPFALPGGLGLVMHGGAGLIRGVLLGTRHGTLIKAKSVQQPPPGFGRPFSEDEHRQAMEMLRAGRYADICRPQRECQCCLEFEQREGRIAWTPFSMHAPRIAELFPVHPLDNRDAALDFLHSAWRVLSGLNAAGISHGDPAFYNFLVGPRVVLIDLDQCVHTGETESVWDQSIFLYSTIAPVLGDFMTPAEMAGFATSLMAGTGIVRDGGAEVLTTALGHVVEHNRSVRLARSHAMHNRSLQIQVTETGEKLSIRLREAYAQYEGVLAIARERDQALLAAAAEMNMLRTAAEERLAVIQGQEAEMERLRSELTSTLEQASRLSNELTTARSSGK